jgi:hypothetical protein
MTTTYRVRRIIKELSKGAKLLKNLTFRLFGKLKFQIFTKIQV